VTCDSFIAIYTGLSEKRDSVGVKLDVSDGQLTEVISALTSANRSDTYRIKTGEPNKSVHIRELHFRNGTKTEEKFITKSQLLIPLRVLSSIGLPYIVSLSLETPGNRDFSNDENSIIRVKSRVSFIINVESENISLQWRVDLTVVRRIMGKNSLSLKNIKSQMFPPELTANNIIEILKLRESATSALYKYEIEIEFIGPKGKNDLVRGHHITAAANIVLSILSQRSAADSIMQTEILRIAKYIAKSAEHLERFQNNVSLKRLLPSVITITRPDYRSIYPPINMFMSDKADGVRAIALVREEKGFIIADTLYGPFIPSSAKSKLKAETILDGELVVNGDVIMFYAFDIIVIAGDDISQDGFEKRFIKLEEGVEILRDANLPAVAKKFKRLESDQPSELEREMKEIINLNSPYKIDGYILTVAGSPYNSTVSYKWKSAKDNTIDFLARRAPKSALGKEPFIDRKGHKLYFLFNGISSDLYKSLRLRYCPGYAELFGETGPLLGAEASSRMNANKGNYFPIQFSTSDMPLAYLYQHPDSSELGEIDGKVVEGRCALITNGSCAVNIGLVKWEMVRIREDRKSELLTKAYYGNDFHTAEIIWINYVDPFPLEQLWEGPSSDYFMRSKSSLHRAQISVISYVKSKRISTFRGNNLVIDLGSGKGQDLGRYLEARVKTLVAIDQDRAALAEMIRRKYRFAKQGKKYSTTIYAVLTDLTAPYEQTTKKIIALGIDDESADAVVCNLAVHYFLSNVAGMRNFVALARSLVKISGKVVITSFIGSAVHELFIKEMIKIGSSWKVYENDVLKYSLKRNYKTNTLEAAGQSIGVLMPFSDGQYYDEYLVNTDRLAEEFCNRGFKKIASASIADHLKLFAEYDPVTTKLLSDNDKLYLSLYGEMVFERVK